MPSAPAAPPTTHPGPTGSATATDQPAVRTVLAGYTVTLVPLLVGLAALELGWELTAGTTWVAAAAAVAGWALAVASWLGLRGWRTRPVRTVLGTAAAVLAAALVAGWLSPAGLVLWGPVTTVLTVALALAEQPRSS
jgi:hypothetical protein